jgi:hypothetical protein
MSATGGRGWSDALAVVSVIAPLLLVAALGGCLRARRRRHHLYARDSKLFPRYFSR